MASNMGMHRGIYVTSYMVIETAINTQVERALKIKSNMVIDSGISFSQ